jgi:putative transposase
MRRSRFTPDQIAAILKEHRSGLPGAALASKYGVSTATLSYWKSKYGNLEPGEASRLQALEDEIASLKKMLAQAKLDNAILRENAH